MSSSAPTPQPEHTPTEADSTTAGDASVSADRLIALIHRINEVDVAASSLADRSAVVELLEVTTDEQRSSLLLALLLERLSAGA